MIKNYFFTLFFVVALLSSTAIYAQMVAQDDFATINGVSGGYENGVRLNDFINGDPGSQVPCNETVLTQISTTNTGVNIDTFCGLITVDEGTPAGTYYIEYQICIAATPSVCDTATVTVFVCEITPPVVDDYTPLSCLTDESVITLTGLPETGTWTLTYINTTTAPEITGTGPTTTLTLPAGGYAFRVTSEDGCRSVLTYFSLFPPEPIAGELVGVYNDVNSDGLVNVGDEIYYTVVVTNTSECEITDIEVVETTFNSMEGTIASLPVNSTDNTTFTAVHIITQEDINNGFVSNYAFISGDINGEQAYTKAFGDFSLDISDGIKMVAFIDENDNGIKDAGEQAFTEGEFTYAVNGGSQVNIYTNTGAHTIYETNPANTFNLGYEINNLPCAGQYVVETPGYTNITVPALSGVVTYYFPITVQPCIDLQTYIYGQEPVPGFNYSSIVVIRNNGNETIASGSVEYIKDPAVTINTVSETSAVITGTGFTYSFTDLEPFEARFIVVNMAVPAIPVVALGDVFNSSAIASVPEGDVNTNNNSFEFSQVVVGAYDPNDKAESHGGYIVHSEFTADDYLTYTIRFENEGTANAQTIRIEDMLDEQLDAASLRMLYASHDYVLERNDNNLLWTFGNIQLPPSVEGSDVGKGYIVFQIKPAAGYEIGTVIENEAGIYFDTNPVIMTNTVTTEFIEALSVDGYLIKEATVYPNPVTNTLYIDNITENATVEVYNQLGQLVIAKEADAQVTLDMSGLANGIYMVNIQSGNSSKTVKVIKK